MPLISDFEGIKIYMYNNGWEHSPPYFHVIFNNFQCIIDIKKIKKIKGKMQKKEIKKIKPLN